MALDEGDLEEVLATFMAEARTVGLEEIADLETYLFHEGGETRLLPTEEIILRAIKKVKSHLTMIDRYTVKKSIDRLAANISNPESLSGAYLDMGSLAMSPDEMKPIPLHELAVDSGDLIERLSELARGIRQSLDPEQGPPMGR